MGKLPTTHYSLLTHKAQAVLSLVFLIGGIITLMGIALAFLASSFINITGGFQAAEQAQAVASSGAYDALMRLSRAKGLSGTYTVPIGSDSASVTVTQNSPSPGLVTVISNATASRRKREIKTIVSRNSTSGVISLVSWDLQ